MEDINQQREKPPELLSLKKYSGKLNVRMPEYLHSELVSEAAWQNVSLNHLIVSKLAKRLYESAPGGKAN